ncbi:hypothetical protein QOZ80_2BG0180290 [Eleusine coracana subsp. coracana]|nr:hypothetical protein QOZ80_2BG0180290 [Eleusine coracana subsp. coracana]
MWCGRTNGVRLRARSGGHDYEGLSYRSERPETFAVVDLANLRAIIMTADDDETAWVDSGATVGELYHTVAKNNTGLAFPAGVCTTLGVGGHFSGGGMGSMMRKYGLSVDNVIDAKLVDASGDLLDRAAMGEDLFWAIRGGGGESFGIVVSWKVRLVKVPSTVTVLRISRTLEQGAIDVVTEWQYVAPTLPDDINMEVLIVQGQQAVFQSLYLGTCHEILPTIVSRLPKLNATTADCNEMTWLESTAFMNFGTTNTTALLDRNIGLNNFFFKNKSDYVRRAIAKGVWRKIFTTWFATMNNNGSGLMMILEPHGGFIASVPTGATPYPHRSGVLYNIQYVASWSAGDDSSVAIHWINDLYDFMGQYVTKSPREAYVNFRDLDIGENTVVSDVSTLDSGKVWGHKYFCSNFHRLATVKGKVDHTDYFRNEQSIPPLLQSNN